VTTTYLATAGKPGLQGHYAGIVTRAGSFALDLFFIVVGFALGGTVAEYVLSALLGTDVNLSDAPVVSVILLVLWAFLYMAYPLTVAGRTLAMAIVGIRAVRTDGHDLERRHAVIRVLALPLSFLLFCFGFLLIVLRRDRRALHDLIAGTAIVYAWDARAARLRFLQKR
jgi:uncharacterized RDD family membrane protein YckC